MFKKVVYDLFKGRRIVLHVFIALVREVFVCKLGVVAFEHTYNQRFALVLQKIT